MKIKIDENLPVSLIPRLQALGHDVDSVMSEGLTGCDDAFVWQAAQQAGRFLITQDLDFSDARKFAPGTHHGILVVRLAEPGREALKHAVEVAFKIEDVESWKHSFVVLTEHKLRVRKS